jgi:hypothetical protein
MDEYGQDTVRAKDNSNDVPRPSVLSGISSANGSTTLKSEAIFHDTVTSIISQVSQTAKCGQKKKMRIYRRSDHFTFIYISYVKIVGRNVGRLL